MDSTSTSIPACPARRYTNIYVGTPSLTDNFQTVEISPQVTNDLESREPAHLSIRKLAWHQDWRMR